MTFYAGIDVPGPQREFDVAVIEDRHGTLSFCQTQKHLTAANVIGGLRPFGPRVIAVDAPSTEAKPGDKSRTCERSLSHSICGIRYTPDRATINAATNGYYDWILNGLNNLYPALRTNAGWRVIECFPTASWTVLFGPRGSRSRARWSRAALATLPIQGLPNQHNQDVRDAIVAAYTAYLFAKKRTLRTSHPPIIV